MDKKLLFFFANTLITPCAFAMTNDMDIEQQMNITIGNHSPVFNALNHSNDIEEAERLINQEIQTLSLNTNFSEELIRRALSAEIYITQIRRLSRENLEQLVEDIESGRAIPRPSHRYDGGVDLYFQHLVTLAGYLGLMY